MYGTTVYNQSNSITQRVQNLLCQLDLDIQHQLLCSEGLQCVGILQECCHKFHLHFEYPQLRVAISKSIVLTQPSAGFRGVMNNVTLPTRNSGRETLTFASGLWLDNDKRSIVLAVSYRTPLCQLSVLAARRKILPIHDVSQRSLRPSAWCRVRWCAVCMSTGYTYFAEAAVASSLQLPCRVFSPCQITSARSDIVCEPQ